MIPFLLAFAAALAGCGGDETRPAPAPPSGGGGGGGGGGGPVGGGGGGGGGGSSNTTPPQVVATNPTDAAVGAALSGPITATFNEAIRTSSVNATTFLVREVGGNLVTGTVSASGTTAQFVPSSALSGATNYEATLTTAITDAAGNALSAPFSWTFRTLADDWEDVALPSLLPRRDHTAVWTGSEMIVWGGAEGTALHATGGRYDPAQNFWRAVSITSAPEPRVDHTAVWTGSEMIVWGGDTALGRASTGGRYTPPAGTGTGTWMATSTGTNTPAPRTLHTAVWTGSRMIVWGGVTDLGLTNTGGRYNPLAATNLAWNPTRTSGLNVPAPRAEHTAVWTGTEMIVWGGITGLGVTNTGGRYNPNTDTWTAMADAPIALFGHVAVWTGSEMIVWGDGSSNQGARYNPATDEWTLMSTQNAPLPRSDITAVWTGSEMLVWGGNVVSNQVHAYRPATDTWRAGGTSDPDTPAARTGHTAVWTGDEMIVWGGEDTLVRNTGARYIP